MSQETTNSDEPQDGETLPKADPASTEAAPTELTPTEVTPTEVAPTEPTPTEVTPTEVTSPDPSNIETVPVAPPKEAATEIATEAATDTAATPTALVETVASGGPTAALPGALDEAEGADPVLVAARYQVLGLLGQGGMGRVLHVRDLEIGDRELALKLLRARHAQRPEFQSLFFEEVKAAQAFVHENVNQVRDTGQDHETGQLYLTMDLVDGESLRSLLKRENSLATRHALEVVRQVLLGLQAGHEKGLIHRDVKPENTMLASRTPKTSDNPFGVRVQILDFGLAGAAEKASDGAIAGTPMYMSPEQAQGQTLDARSDLFAVGIVLYEMIAGSRPFHGGTVEKVVSSVLETDVAPLIAKLAHLPPSVQKLLQRALEKKRGKRFQSAGEFIKAIETAPAFRLPSRIPRWAAAGLLVLGAGTAAAGVLWVDGKSTGKELSQLRTQLRSKQEQVDALQISMEQASAASQKRIDDLNAKVASVASARTDERITEERGDRRDSDEMGTLRNRVSLLENNAEQFKTDLQGASTRNLALEQGNLDLQGRIDDLQEEVDVYRRTDDIRFVATTGLDKILKRVGLDAGRKARDAFIVLSEQDIVESVGGIAGGDFLQSFTDTAAAIQDHRDATDEVRREIALEEAVAANRLAIERFVNFRELSQEWIVSIRAEGESPDRIADLVAALERQTAYLEQAVSVASDDRLRSWNQAIALSPADQDPELVLTLGVLLGEGRAATTLSAFASYLEQSHVTDASLRTAGLTGLTTLPGWREAIEREGLGSSPESQTILAFERAARWFGTSDDMSLKGPLPLLEQGEPRANWRAALTLRMHLGARGQRLEGGADSQSLYRVITPEGQTTWHLETVRPAGDPPPDSEAAWLVEKVVYGQDGQRLFAQPAIRMLKFPRGFAKDGQRTARGWGNRRLRLDEVGPEYLVAGWLPARAGDVPFALPVDLQAAAAFRATIASPLPCLVTRIEGTEAWFSPDLGLVRETNQRGQTRELVYARRDR